VLNFLYTPVSWVLLRWHQLLTALGMDPAGGATWALSIVLLVVTARLLLFRLFIKQVHYQRKMQDLQPKLSAIREKYKNDRAEQQRAMMELQQQEGFNPLSGCLPMFLQIPVFISLFHVLRHLSNSVAACQQGLHTSQLTLYTFTNEQTCSAARAVMFGGAPLAGSLRDSPSIIKALNGDISTTRWVTILLVVISAAATYFTQILVMRRAATAPVGTAATVQRLMKFFIPISVLFSGVFFPLGVLLYWFTSNVWTMLQQVYINRYHPHTPTEAPAVGTAVKALRPKPGQRPTRDARGRAAAASPGDGVSLSKDGAGGAPADGNTGAPGDGATSADGDGMRPVRPTAPRPGQRPSRPQGKRPTGKRPPQAKKRR
jgi:YidC/Oxa1 family membrane protein insertase